MTTTAATWSTTSSLFVGRAGSGSGRLTVSNGGLVTAANLYADPANLHVIARNFRTGANDFTAIHQGHLGDIVRYQAVSPLDQRQHALTFANPALASNNHTDTQNIDHAAQLASARREHHL